MSKKTEKKQRVKFSIGTKLILIFAFLVLFVLGMVTGVITVFSRNDEYDNARNTNMDSNQNAANSVAASFSNIQHDADGLLKLLTFLKNDENYEQEATYFFGDLCRRDENVKFIYSEEIGFLISSEFAKKFPDTENIFDEWLKKNKGLLSYIREGNFEVKNISPLFIGTKEPVLCILYKYNNGVVAVVFSVEPYITKLCLESDSSNNSIVINKAADALIFQDTDVVLQGGNISDLEIIKKLFNQTEKNKNEKLTITDESGNTSIYSYSSILDGSMYVITTVPNDVVYEIIERTTYRIILVAISIFFLAILIIRIFSKTLTKPIGELVVATNEIEKGNYDIQLSPSTKDEIGVLTSSFLNMTGGLKERQHLMDSFSKFTNKIIAEKAAKGELTREGINKNATIFFSDIRSFTAMSEKMTPEEVVDFLNDYFSRMVDCVNKTNGIVDKFIGDAIMAVWGAATTCGSPKEDAWAAVKAALMMRIALYQFNMNQIKNGKKPIKIGCGINSGPIVAGQIGSEDHMNYTVIGDAVNLASRTEALNKPFATDILITENTYKLIKEKVIVEEMPGVTVKGKTDPIRMFAVVNAVGVKGPSDIHELRKFLGWEEPDITKVNTDEEEKKYKIKG